MARIRRLYCRVHRRYYINGRFLTGKATGVQRFAEEIIKSLDRMIADGEIDSSRATFEILTPHKPLRPVDFHHITVRRTGRLSGHTWEQFMLPWYIRDGFLLNLCNTGPLYVRNQLTAIHDAGIIARPGDYRLRFRVWYKPMMPRLGKYSRLILTVSEFSKGELHRDFGIPRDKIHVVSLSGEHMIDTPPDNTILDEHRLNGQPFLLAVNAMNTRKNLGAVIEAMKLLGPVDFKVVVTGSDNSRVFSPAHWDLPETFQHIGYIADARLRSLYSHATALIFPSLYEGFGLPPLEAMTCGCPVLVSDIPAHRETCGDAAAYCDPNDPSDIAEKIGEIMSNGAMRSDLISKGAARSKQFTWKNTVAKLLRRLDPACLI